MSSELKGLNTRKTKILSEVDSNKEEIKRLQRMVAEAKREVDAIDHQIEALTSDIIVSEHALLRYLERRYSIERETIEDEILTDAIKAQIKVLGNGKYPIGNGLRAVVKNNVVVSITPIK